MKSTTEYLVFNIPARMDFKNITPTIEQIVRKSGIQEELCPVNAMHITASVFINDDESGLHQDYNKDWLEELAPHATISRYATTAQVRTTGMGRDVPVAVTTGRLDLWHREQIFYGEFDGRRPKRVLVKVIGE